MLPRLFHTSIVFRSATIVCAIALAVGTLFAATANSILMRGEREQIKARMNELLDAVESTASIACFLPDKNLASEVARGLVKNHFISEVTIKSGGSMLAHARIPGQAGAQESRLVREVVSPFNPREVVCEIMLQPNDAAVLKQAARRSRLIAYLLLAQAIAMALGVVYIVMKQITRPIKSISDRLHGLSPEAGEQLYLPAGHAKDEIGRLVGDVNALITGLAVSLQDERSLRMQREVEEKKFRAIFENAETGIFVVDHAGRLFSYNRAFMRVLDLRQDMPIDELNRMLPELLGAYEQRVRALVALAVAENRAVSEDFRVGGSSRDGPPKWVSLVLSPIEDGKLQGLLNDISERKQSEESARRLAVTDPLTGLANRLGFEKELARTIERARLRAGECFALMMIDLDWFKQVNDSYGHEAGDTVLRHCARVLGSAVRKNDLVARIGGDEFVIVLKADNPPESAERVAQQILDTIAHPVPIGGGIEVRVGASIGIAVFDASCDKDELISRADRAMYQSKRRGKNAWSVFDSLEEEKASG